ncbi:hypothetical protein MLGJGCBP_02318 [Rhodococcus sp. T7]|nr:hypothetical protein MLGJGCBP_02318 [Rhodococcus sp. T7]
MSAGDVPQCRAEGIDVERSLDTHDHGNVVGGCCGVELVDEPHPLLREGDRRGLTVLARTECRSAGGQVFLRVEDCRQGLYGRRLEQRAYSDFGAESGVEPGHHLRRDEGRAAQFEEVVVDPHAGDAEYASEDSGDRFLVHCSGGAELRDVHEKLGHGQCCMVDGTGGVEGNRVDDDDRGRHQVRGQGCRSVRSDRGRVHGRAGCRRDVGHQHRLAGGASVVDGDRFVDGVMLAQNRVHLVGRDSVTAKLSLKVAAPQYLQPPVPGDSREIARAVHALARVSEGAGHEVGGSECRPVVVPAGQFVTAGVQLADDSVRHEIQPAVEHDGASIGAGPQGEVGHLARRGCRHGSEAREGFGDRVQVDDGRRGLHPGGQ